MSPTYLLRLCALLLCLCCIGGCKDHQATAPAGGSATKNTGGPGIDFRKVSEGLRYKTLDYIGTEGFTLAGAHSGAKVFFGVKTERGYTLFSRDLKSGERRAIADFSSVVPGTLSTDDQGDWLFFCRDREMAKYVDDPSVKAPERIGLVYRMKSAGGQEEALFDFRDPQFLPFRKYGLTPFCSASGNRVAALTFDFEQSLLTGQCADWQGYWQETYQPASPLRPEELHGREQELRNFFTLPKVAAFIEAKGLVPSSAGKVTDADSKIVSAFEQSLGDPIWAVLLWEQGKSRVVQINTPTGMEKAVLVLQAVGEKYIVLAGQQTEEDGTPYSNLYTLDLSTGELNPAGRYTGVPSNLQLAEDESAMLVALTPYDPEGKKFNSVPVLRRLPLDGSAATDVPLPGPFDRYLDFGPDAREAVAQDSVSRNLCFLDLATGKATVLCRLNSELGGLFYSPAAKQAVFLESGFTFQVPVVAEAETDPNWVGPDYFAAADTALRDFLGKLGLQLPATFEARWEEREGSGAHEYSAFISGNQDSKKPLLVRIDAANGLKVESVWMPGGYPWPANSELQGGDLDEIDCEKRAAAALDRVGWLSQSKQKYQPGGSPIYDDPTKSFIIVHRDGYSLRINGKEEWVFNAESTVRVNKVTGQIAEMTLSLLPEVMKQKADIPMDEVLVSIRNKGPQPIPEAAPVRFDTQNYRLVVADKGVKTWGPAEFTHAGQPRLCYEIDGFLKPEDQLIMTTRVDTETGDVLGQVTFLPSNQQKALGRM